MQDSHINTDRFKMKQVIVVRKDLKMSIGKLSSQACHASLESSEEAKKQNRTDWKTWHEEGAKKVVVQVGSLEELLELEEKARHVKLPIALIIDRGLTELQPNTPTALGIGPAKIEIIDKITKHLKLL